MASMTAEDIRRVADVVLFVLASRQVDVEGAGSSCYLEPAVATEPGGNPTPLPMVQDSASAVPGGA